MFTRQNYFIKTRAVFKGCKRPKRNPNFISASGSKYWYGVNKNGYYVIRESDHWVLLKEVHSQELYHDCEKIATCHWHLNTTVKLPGRQNLCGKAYFKDFKKISD